MTKTDKTALLWFVAGVASTVGGAFAEPHRVLAIVAGVLFFALSLQSVVRGRHGQSPPPP